MIRGALTAAAVGLLLSLAASGSQVEAASSPPAKAPNAYAGRVGFDAHTVGFSEEEGYRSLSRLRAGGVTWIREDFPWNYMEPQRGKFVWAYTDRLMINMSRLGMDVLAVVDYTSAWASGRTDSFKYPPRDPRSYGSFVKLIATRYGQNGTFWRLHRTLKPRPLKAIEIWNEPWHHDFWGPDPDPRAYARLVRAAAGAIKSVHPEIKVLASADVFQSREDGTDPDWFAPLLTVDRALWRSRLVDAWSVHLYCQKLSPYDTTADQRYRFDRLLISKALADRADASKPFWITEFGWNMEDVDESTQATYTVQALKRSLRDWGGFVAKSFIYNWAPPSAGDSYDLIRPDGSTRLAWEKVQVLLRAG